MLNLEQNIIIFFISFILLSVINCQLKIPLKYYPFYKYDYSSPPIIMRNIIQQQVYASIEIGTPKATVEIPLKFDSNDFIITDFYSSKKDIHRFANIKYYNSSASKSFNETDDYEDYYSADFGLGYYKKDIFNFNNKDYVIEFYYPLDYNEPDSGSIGMKLDPEAPISNTTPDKERTFFEKLKKRGLAKGYFWSIFYNSRNYKTEDEATLLIGCLPHEMNTDLGYYKKGYFNNDDKRTVQIEIKYLHIQNILYIDFIFGYEGSNQKKVINDFPIGITDYKEIQLDYLSGGVRGPTDLKKYYHRVFEEYILKGQCFNSTIINKTDIFYYCKNDKNIISKIKSVFPGINFRSQDLDYNFTLEADDLFIEENGYVYCLLYFVSSNKKSWEMGKPFLKKYLFTINYDERYISYYRVENEENKKNNSDTRRRIGVGVGVGLFVTVIIITIVIVVIICAVIFKFCLYDKLFRKKRANELDDADFDYTPKNDNEKNSLNIDS